MDITIHSPKQIIFRLREADAALTPGARCVSLPPIERNRADVLSLVQRVWRLVDEPSPAA